LAQIHAKFWQDPGLANMLGIDVVFDATGSAASWPRECGGENLRRLIDGPRGKLMPSYARAPERIERAFWRMVETLDRRNGRCLLHGDPHPGNCFSDADGGAGLYDWQTLARGPWAYDVSYALTTALCTTERRHHERDLLAHYLSTLLSLGVKSVPGFAEAWDDYCRYIAYALLIWPTNRTSHQAEENIRALTERLGAAAADFNVFERWGV
jgi:Ser/Thr protein kinase RdoA (MazF antagonist)